MSGMQRAALCAVLLLLGACKTVGPQTKGTPQERAAVLTSLGVAYLQKGEPRLAVPELEKAVALDDESIDAYNTLGLVYQQLEQPALAEKSFKKALAINPKSSEVLNNYGVFLFSQGDLNTAQAHLQKALLDPLYATPHYALVNLARVANARHDKGAARQYLERALRLMPKYYPALLEIAQVDYADGKIDQALVAVTQVLTMAPDSADALLIAGQIARDRANIDLARQYFQQVVDKAPFSPQARTAQAMLLQLP